VEDGYEFFAKRQLVTLFSAPNYCGEFDNAGAMMSVDETLLCSFQVRSAPHVMSPHILCISTFVLKGHCNFVASWGSLLEPRLPFPQYRLCSLPLSSDTYPFLPQFSLFSHLSSFIPFYIRALVFLPSYVIFDVWLTPISFRSSSQQKRRQNTLTEG
jgi:hypothetical protein